MKSIIKKMTTLQTADETLEQEISTGWENQM